MTHPVVEFARDELGFTYTPRQAAIIDEIYRDAIRIGVLRLGRRSGKGRIAGGLAVFEATVNAAAHLAHVPPGERLAIVVISSSQRNARTVHGYIRGWLRRPSLAHLLVRDTVDELELSNGIVIMTLPCHAASARGLAIPVLILDEAAWYMGRDGSLIDPAEIYDGLGPATAQFPERRILVTSTPRWSVGWFADMCERAGSGRFADMRHWHATTADMNPWISPAFLAGERAKDEAVFRREYEAEFDSGIGAMFDADSIRLAVREGGGDLPPRPGVRYLVSVDQAFVGDVFAVTVGHRGEQNAGDLVVVDRVTGRKGSRSAPLLVDVALDEVADLARAYNDASVVLDQFASAPLTQALRARGISVRERIWSAESKVAAATSARRVLNAARLSLPPHAALVAELMTLEQRPLPSGRIRIAAPGGGHDDFAMALLALVDELDAGGREARSRSTLPETGGPIVRRGELVFKGERYVDKPTPNYPWRP